MAVLNFGSINIDQFFEVPYFVRPGETLASTAYTVRAGGKGLNQSVALARAGATVFHAGKVNRTDDSLLQFLNSAEVDTTYIERSASPTGQAVIQVTPSGENAILLSPGANREISKTQIQSVLQKFGKGDYLVLQNEINSVSELIIEGKQREMFVVFNPSPVPSKEEEIPLHLIDLLIANELEAQAITGMTESAKVFEVLAGINSAMSAVITLGSQGARGWFHGEIIAEEAVDVDVVDTTGAGDTFLGYVVASLMLGGSPEDALNFASRAAALCVTRKGAASSIPLAAEVERFSVA